MVLARPSGHEDLHDRPATSSACLLAHPVVTSPQKGRFAFQRDPLGLPGRVVSLTLAQTPHTDPIPPPYTTTITLDKPIQDTFFQHQPGCPSGRLL